MDDVGDVGDVHYVGDNVGDMDVDVGDVGDVGDVNDVDDGRHHLPPPKPENK